MDLDDDHYFDPRIRNVIVLDDLISIAAKDPRINDLFTEGSHHRNLSVDASDEFHPRNHRPTYLIVEGLPSLVQPDDSLRK
jgi:hypothetical protein